MLAMIRDDLATLRIEQEVFFSERSLTRDGEDAVASAIEALKRKGLIYSGRLPAPKGQTSDDWEDREQILFRSTAFGDDVDRALVKSNGSYTYFASDIAYHKSKIDRGFRSMIDVWGADHGGYVKRMQAAVAAMSDRKAALDVKLCQLVKLMRNGEPVKMSKRAGDFVTLREVVDEVGRRCCPLHDAVPEERCAAGVRSRQGDRAVEGQPGFLRAIRPCARLLRTQDGPGGVSRCGAGGSAIWPMRTSTLLEDEGERALMKLLAQYPRLVEAAALAHEPHRIAFYLYDLASAFHSHWNKGRDQPQLRFVNENERHLTCARLALVMSLTFVIRSGLAILGVSAPEEMR